MWEDVGVSYEWSRVKIVCFYVFLMIHHLIFPFIVNRTFFFETFVISTLPKFNYQMGLINQVICHFI